MPNQCLDGRPTLIKCPDMLLFDRVRGVCDYADLADTSNCLLERESTNNEKKKKNYCDYMGLKLETLIIVSVQLNLRN
jgi:hypothetical protein